MKENDAGQFLGKWFKTTPVSLTVLDGITWEEFASGCSTVSRLANFTQESLPYIIGDLINAGERLFPNKYEQALEFTDYTLSTLKNYAWMCSRVPPENRGIVGIQHTMIAAKYKDVDEQRRYLMRCRDERLTAREFRMLANGEKNYKKRAVPHNIAEPKKAKPIKQKLMELFERIYEVERYKWEFAQTFRDGAIMVWERAVDETMAHAGIPEE